jgi:hypothetical protein
VKASHFDRLLVVSVLVAFAATAYPGQTAAAQPVTITAQPVSNNAAGGLDPGVSIVGNEMIMPAGARAVYIDYRIGDWDPQDTGRALRAYQVRVDPSGYASGLAGTLTPRLVGCDQNADCDPAFGVESTCDFPTGCDGEPPCYCTPMYLDSSRGGANPWVFTGVPGGALAAVDLACVSGVCSQDYGAFSKTLSSSQNEPVPFPAGGMYAATLVLNVPADARGTFTVGMKPPNETGLVDQFSELMEVDLVPAKITIPVGRCCHNIGPGTGDCTDGLLPEECDALPRVVGSNVFGLNAACQGDGDDDGVDDACPLCGVPAAPQFAKMDANPNAPVVLVDLRNNRNFALQVPGSAGRPQGVRVRFKSLPPPWDVWNATQMWVTMPVAACETAGAGLIDLCPAASPRFWAAGLSCNLANAAFLDWTLLGTVYVFHPGLIPSSRGATPGNAEYEIQVIDATCDPSDENSFSAVTTLVGPRWGDVSGPLDVAGGYFVAADGRVDITVDIEALSSKFRNHPQAPSKTRVDLEPCRQDFRINVSDLVRGLDAFRGIDYPFTLPGPSIFGCVNTDPCFYTVP